MAIGLILFIILTEAVLVGINFLEGYAVGWLAAQMFYGIICAGFALIGLSISPASIPLLFGILNVLGSFFRPSTVKELSTETVLNKEE